MEVERVISREKESLFDGKIKGLAECGTHNGVFDWGVDADGDLRVRVRQCVETREAYMQMLVHIEEDSMMIFGEIALRC